MSNTYYHLIINEYRYYIKYYKEKNDIKSAVILYESKIEYMRRNSSQEDNIHIDYVNLARLYKPIDAKYFIYHVINAIIASNNNLDIYECCFNILEDDLKISFVWNGNTDAYNTALEYYMSKADPIYIKLYSKILYRIYATNNLFDKFIKLHEIVHIDYYQHTYELCRMILCLKHDISYQSDSDKCKKIYSAILFKDKVAFAKEINESNHHGIISTHLLFHIKLNLL